MNREEFLHYIKDYIEKDPEAAALVADFVQAGLRNALRELNERAADMEVALVALATHRYKGKDKLVKDKILKWKGKTAINWDWLTEN